MTDPASDRTAAAGPPLGTPGAEHVEPAVLTSLLARHGWRRRSAAAASYSRWTPPDQLGTSVLVPAAADFADGPELLAEALTALARCGSPAARQVLADLSAPGDRIRWRCEMPRTAAAVPWTSAERLHRAARGMLLAAACASRGAAGYFGARHAAEAAAYLEDVLIGPAPGAHQLTAYTPAPAGRPVTTVLLRALQATRDAVDYQRATDRQDAFDDAVRLGVCHELLDALSHAVRGTEGIRIELAWSPAAGAPKDIAAHPEPVEFSPGDLPALHQAAARCRRAEPAVAVDLTGAVVRLRSTRPGSGGTAWLRVMSGADVDTVRVALDADGYRLAIRAHLDGAPLRLAGRLESRGGFRLLTAVRGLTAVPVDEAERERLWKWLEAPAGD